MCEDFLVEFSPHVSLFEQYMASLRLSIDRRKINMIEIEMLDWIGLFGNGKQVTSMPRPRQTIAVIVQESVRSLSITAVVVVWQRFANRTSVYRLS